MAESVFNASTGVEEEYTALAKGENAAVWIMTYADDLGMLAQVIRKINGTNTIKFIIYSKVPKHKKVTYGKNNVTLRPLKERKYRVRLTVGGDRLEFSGVTKT